MGLRTTSQKDRLPAAAQRRPASEFPERSSFKDNAGRGGLSGDGTCHSCTVARQHHTSFFSLPVVACGALGSTSRSYSFFAHAKAASGVKV